MRESEFMVNSSPIVKHSNERHEKHRFFLAICLSKQRSKLFFLESSLPTPIVARLLLLPVLLSLLSRALAARLVAHAFFRWHPEGAAERGHRARAWPRLGDFWVRNLSADFWEQCPSWESIEK